MNKAATLYFEGIRERALQPRMTKIKRPPPPPAVVVPARPPAVDASGRPLPAVPASYVPPPPPRPPKPLFAPPVKRSGTTGASLPAVGSQSDRAAGREAVLPTQATAAVRPAGVAASSAGAGGSSGASRGGASSSAAVATPVAAAPPAGSRGGGGTVPANTFEVDLTADDSNDGMASGPLASPPLQHSGVAARFSGIGAVPDGGGHVILEPPASMVPPELAGSDEWIHLRPMTVDAYALTRGALPAAAKGHRCAVWREGGAYTQKLIEKRHAANNVGARGRPANTSIAASLKNVSTTVRFGVRSSLAHCDEIGRLSRELSLILWPILDGAALQSDVAAVEAARGRGVAKKDPAPQEILRASVFVVAYEHPLQVFADMTLRLGVSVRRSAFRCFHDTAAGPYFANNAVVRDSLYSLIFYAHRGVLVLPPASSSGAGGGAAAAAASSAGGASGGGASAAGAAGAGAAGSGAAAAAASASAAAGSSGGAADVAADGDGVEPTAVADNTDERVQAGDVESLYRTATVVRKLAKAPQPTSLVNISLRPYQRQALHWLLARENTSVTNVIVTGSEPPTADGQAGTVEVVDDDDGDDVDDDAAARAEADETAALANDPLMRSVAADAAARGGSSNPMWETCAVEGGVVYVNPYSRSVMITQPPVLRPCRCVLVVARRRCALAAARWLSDVVFALLTAVQRRYSRGRNGMLVWCRPCVS